MPVDSTSARDRRAMMKWDIRQQKRDGGYSERAAALVVFFVSSMVP